VDLDPLLPGRRRDAAVRDGGERAVRKAQRDHDAVARLHSQPAPAGQASDVLDRGADKSRRGVDEMAYFTQQSAALPPIPIPVIVRHPARGGPIHDQLGPGYAVEDAPRGQHGGRPAPVEADRELTPRLPPGSFHRVEFAGGQRERFRAPHVLSRPERPRRQVGMRVVRGGDDDDLDVRVTDHRVRAGHRLLEAVADGGPHGGQAAGRGHRHEMVEAGGTEGRQERPGERAGPGPANPR